jgi:CheY-like chemotaxis protein
MAKILIVDDEPTIRGLFEYVFKEAGHEVSLAKNGRKALAAVESSIPDFVILDIAMPEMSGPEFAVELMRLAEQDPRLRGIPFVVMTGENFMESGINSVFAATPGFVCFFPKMTPPEQILEKAEEILHNPAAGKP